MAAAGNAAAAVVIVVVLAVMVTSPPAHAFRAYFEEDAELLRNKGRTTVVEMAVAGSQVPAGAPRGVDIDVELIAFPAGQAADGVDAGDFAPSPVVSAGVDGLLPDTDRAAADVILP